MNILDLIVLIIFSMTIYFGYSKGIVMTVFNLLGVVLSVFMTYFYHPVVKNMLAQMTGLDEKLLSYVLTRLKMLGAQATQASVSISDLSALEKLPLPGVIKEQITNHLISAATSQATTVATVVTDLVMSFMAMVLLFLMILVALKTVASVLNMTTKLPVIRTFNNLGGATFGLIIGYAMSSVLFVGLMSILTIKQFDFLQGQLEASLIADFLVNHNVLLVWLQFFV